MTDDPTNELADLKAAWNRLEQRHDAELQKVETLTSTLAADRSRSLARRALLPPIVDLVVEGFGLAVLISGSAYAGSATYGLSLLLCTLVLVTLIGFAVAQIVLLGGIEADAPVLATQRQIARARSLRIFEWKWVLLLSPLLWGPFFVVAVELPLKALSGGSPEASVFGAGYFWANLAIGAVLTVGLAGLSRSLARKLRGTTFLSNFMDDLAGRRLAAARDFVERLDRFGRD